MRKNFFSAYWWFVGLLILAQIPFFVLCFYNFPLGTHEWDWISNWRGDPDLSNVEGFWQMQRYWYLHTMGRYSSTFLLSLTPYWFTLESFKWVFVLNLLMLNAGTLFLLRQWFYSWTQRKVVLVGFSIIALYFFQLTNVYESLYRLTVVAIYQVGLIATLFLVGLLAKGLRAGRLSIGQLGLVWLLGAVIPGTNEISLACLHLVLLGIWAGRKMSKLSIPFWFKVLYFIVVIGTGIAIAAPGNFVRMELYPSMGRGFFYDIGFPLGVSIYQWIEWLSSSLLIPAILFWLLYDEGKEARGQKKIWGLWFALTFLMPFIVLFPFLKATAGISLPERIVDLLYFGILLGCLGVAVYSPYAYEGFSGKPGSAKPLAFVLLFYILGHLFLGGLSLDRSGVNSGRSNLSRIEVDSNIGKAILCLLKGEPQRYRNSVLAQYEELKACPFDTCLLTPLPIAPPFAVYDTLYDRRVRRGEPFMGWYFQERQMWVWYNSK